MTINIIGVNGVGGRLPSGGPREGGGYLPYHFSGRDFGAKIQKRPQHLKKWARKFKIQKVFFGLRPNDKGGPLPLNGRFAAEGHFIQCKFGPAARGGGRHVLAVVSVGARGGGGVARARQQPVKPMTYSDKVLARHFKTQYESPRDNVDGHYLGRFSINNGCTIDRCCMQEHRLRTRSIGEDNRCLLLASGDALCYILLNVGATIAQN